MCQLPGEDSRVWVRFLALAPNSSPLPKPKLKGLVMGQVTGFLASPWALWVCEVQTHELELSVSIQEERRDSLHLLSHSPKG